MLNKTKIVIVTTRQKWQYHDKKTINMCIKGDNLEVVETKKLLGLQVDNVLTWRVKYRQSLLVFKAVNELAPDYNYVCVV